MLQMNIRNNCRMQTYTIFRSSFMIFERGQLHILTTFVLCYMRTFISPTNMYM